MSYLYYTNPDGTIGTIEATHDQAGNLRPAGSISSQYNGYTNSDHSSSKKRSEIISRSTQKSNKKTKSNSCNLPKSLVNTLRSKVNVKKSKEFTTIEELSAIIRAWQKIKGFVPKEKNIQRILRKIASPHLRDFFRDQVQSCFNSHNTTDYHLSNLETSLEADSKTEGENGYELIERLAQFRTKHSPRKIVNGVSKVIYKRKNTVRQVETAKSFDSVSGTITSVDDVLACIDSYRRREVLIPQVWIDSMSNNITRSGIRDFFRAKCAAYNRECRFDSKQSTKEVRVHHVKVSTPVIPSAKPVKKTSKPVETPRRSNDLSSARGVYASTSSVEYVHPSRNKPKYGYARDRYGRIQERDHYVESRETNRYHDNSNYDREDDNDSMYSGFE